MTDPALLILSYHIPREAAQMDAAGGDACGAMGRQRPQTEQSGLVMAALNYICNCARLRKSHANHVLRPWIGLRETLKNRSNNFFGIDLQEDVAACRYPSFRLPNLPSLSLARP